MADKPLDILAPEAPAQSAPGAVDLAFAGMFDAAKGCFANIAYTAQSFSDHSGRAGMAAIRTKYAGDPRLAAIETFLAIFGQQWPQVSSSPLPPIYEQPLPPPAAPPAGEVR